MVVWNLGLIGVATIGFAAVVVAIVNRLHGFAVPGPVLHRIRQGHDLLILCYPCALILGAGFGARGLLNGGTWQELSLPWMSLLGLGYLGLIGTIGHALLQPWRRWPPIVLRHSTRSVNVERELGYRPSGAGPHAYMLHVPGNEVFQVDFVEVDLRLPKSNPNCDGLTILHLSDWHLVGTVDRPYFDYVTQQLREQPADLVLFTGDLLDRQDLVSWLPETLGRIPSRLGRFFILGNHDWYLDPPQTRHAMEELGWTNLASKSTIVRDGDRRILLAGTEVPWMGTHPEIGSDPVDLKILMSHTPDNYPWAKQHRFDLVLAGHNHGGQIRLPLFGPVYSPSRYGCRYASGIFLEQETVMSVSRGLSGRHPLRLNCRPEVTRIILRTGE